jgi:hypothetical protein
MEAVDAPAADVQVEAPAGPAQLHAAADSHKELQFINICLTDINAKTSCQAADIAHAALADAIGDIAEELFAPTWNALSCTVAQKIAAFTDIEIAGYECIESMKEVRDRCHLFVSYNLMRYTRQKQHMKVSARILHTINYNNFAIRKLTISSSRACRKDTHPPLPPISPPKSWPTYCG